MIKYEIRENETTIQFDTMQLALEYNPNAEVFPVEVEEPVNNQSNFDLVNSAKLYLTNQFGVSDVLDLMTSLNNEILLYLQGNKVLLIDSIQSSNKSYLTQEIKDALICILTFNG